MGTSKRGFASMDAAKQREIASKGGRAAHAKGTAHEFTADEARVAGRKGGEAVSRDREHMASIGREGGHSRGARARAAAASDPGRSDVAQTSAPQPFVRQANEDRNTFDSNRTSPGYSKERSGNTRIDRNDSENSGGALTGRERI